MWYTLPNMIRTQLYLPKELYQELNMLAQKENKPTAQVVRETLKRGLSYDSRPTMGEALKRLTQINIQGPADLSTNLDDYLYGDKK